jgi:hypothetical protein
MAIRGVMSPKSYKNVSQLPLAFAVLHSYQIYRFMWPELYNLDQEGKWLSYFAVLCVFL